MLISDFSLPHEGMLNYCLILMLNTGCQIGGDGVTVAQDLPKHFFATLY